MNDFLASTGFILSFLIATLGISMVFGEKVLFTFLVLVLAGMVLPNTGKISLLLARGVN